MIHERGRRAGRRPGGLGAIISSPGLCSWPETQRGSLSSFGITQVTVVDRATRQTLATNTIDPDHTYWRNNEREPGRWPGSHTNDDARHL